MSADAIQIQEFMNCFRGALHNYGEHIYGTAKNAGGKLEGVSRTVSDKLLTIEEYTNHIQGKKGLGVIPINESSKCRFSVIDVDVYGMDYTPYIEAIEKFQFPLVPFKSKSGGVHLYTFYKEETNPALAVECMKRMAFLLSIDIMVRSKKDSPVEIFPKQIRLQKGDKGNWINLPYFNAKDTKNGAIRNGRMLSFDEALSYIREKQTTVANVKSFLDEMVLNDAPPCLQLLTILNPLGENSGRNNFLFSFGVYLKKKDEEFFEQGLKEVNRAMLKPIDEKELEVTIVKSLRKKDYLYKCSDAPCIDFCNKKECKKREFGIGKEEGYFSSVELGQLSQFKSSQPYYEWEVRLHGQEEFKVLRFKSEEEIIKQDVFLKLCMRELHELPSKVKQAEWFVQVNQALKNIKQISIHEEDDTSPIVILKSLIVDFLTSRAMADTKEQILAKRVYFDNETKSYLFRVKDLSEYLYITKQFRFFSPQELHGILKEMKGEPRKIRTESKKQIRVMAILRDLVNLDDISEAFTPDFSTEEEEEQF